VESVSTLAADEELKSAEESSSEELEELSIAEETCVVEDVDAVEDCPGSEELNDSPEEELVTAEPFPLTALSESPQLLRSTMRIKMIEERDKRK